MRGRFYPNSGNKETEPQRLCNSLKVIYHYVMKPGIEHLFVRLPSPYSLPPTTSYKYNYHYSYRPLSKQKSEEELKDKNQILEAVNKQLHQKLTETQVRDPPDLCHQPHWVMHVEPRGTAPQTTPAEGHRPDLSAWHPHREN